MRLGRRAFLALSGLVAAAVAIARPAGTTKPPHPPHPHPTTTTSTTTTTTLPGGGDLVTDLVLDRF